MQPTPAPSPAKMRAQAALLKCNQYVWRSGPLQSAPSSTSFDETKVNPGAIGGLVFLGLTIAVVFLLISFNRHIKKVNFEQEEPKS